MHSTRYTYDETRICEMDTYAYAYSKLNTFDSSARRCWKALLDNVVSSDTGTETVVHTHTKQNQGNVPFLLLTLTPSYSR